MRNSESRFCEAGIKTGGFTAKRLRLKQNKIKETFCAVGERLFVKYHFWIRNRCYRSSMVDHPSGGQKTLGEAERPRGPSGVCCGARPGPAVLLPHGRSRTGAEMEPWREWCWTLPESAPGAGVPSEGVPSEGVPTCEPLLERAPRAHPVHPRGFGPGLSAVPAARSEPPACSLRAGARAGRVPLPASAKAWLSRGPRARQPEPRSPALGAPLPGAGMLPRIAAEPLRTWTRIPMAALSGRCSACSVTGCTQGITDPKTPTNRNSLCKPAHKQTENKENSQNINRKKLNPKSNKIPA